jgi:hypothetical protein
LGRGCGLFWRAYLQVVNYGFNTCYLGSIAGGSGALRICIGESGQSHNSAAGLHTNLPTLYARVGVDFVLNLAGDLRVVLATVAANPCTERSDQQQST